MQALKEPEMPVPDWEPESEARASFLAQRCWQDALRGGDPHTADVAQRLENIIAEFDLLFGAHGTQERGQPVSD